MKYVQIDLYGTTYNVRPEVCCYIAGNLAVQLIDDEEEPFAMLTVNLPESREMIGNAKDLAFVDTNNCPWAIQLLEETGWAKPVGKYAHSGFCVYPLYKFDLEAMDACYADVEEEG